MDAIRIENLRCLADTGLIDIKPITLLVGANSSGKSTFLRAFPLLQQSIMASVGLHSREPILWYKEKGVDFGSFQEAIRIDATPPEMVFQWQFSSTALSQFKDQNDYYPPQPRFFQGQPVLFTVKIIREPNAGRVRTKEYSVAFAEHQVRIEFDNDGKVSSFRVNTLDVLSESHGDFIELFEIEDRNSLMPRIVLKRLDLLKGKSNILIYHRLLEKIQGYLGAKTSEEDARKLIAKFHVGSSESILESLKQASDLKTWQDHFKTWTVISPEFQQLRDFIVAGGAAYLMDMIPRYLEKWVANVNYIGPLRATAERYYRFQSEQAVNQVDSQGQNLAAFLYNLTPEERQQLGQWTEQHFSFIPDIRMTGGHLSITVTETREKPELNLADVGFGFSQILPLVTELWWLSSGNGVQRWTEEYTPPVILVIEQPELHLHPRLQAQLADAFLVAIKQAREAKVDLRLIVETHSKTIINRFGHRIVNGDADCQDINVVVFEKEAVEVPVKIRVAKYDKAGLLVNWPYGFLNPDVV